MQVQDFKFHHLCQVLDAVELVLGHQEHLQSGQRKVLDILDEIVVQVQVQQVRQGNQILDLPDLVVLEGQHL